LRPFFIQGQGSMFDRETRVEIELAERAA